MKSIEILLSHSFENGSFMWESLTSLPFPLKGKKEKAIFHPREKKIFSHYFHIIWMSKKKIFDDFLSSFKFFLKVKGEKENERKDAENVNITSCLFFPESIFLILSSSMETVVFAITTIVFFGRDRCKQEKKRERLFRLECVKICLLKHVFPAQFEK